MDHAEIRALGELGLHHELSSLIWRRDAVLRSRWTWFAPPDAKFKERIRDSIARGEERDPDPGTGFLTAYGSSTPENDFNIYAEKVFADAEHLKSMASMRDLIRRKLRFILDTYEQIDGRLHDYFVESGLDSASH